MKNKKLEAILYSTAGMAVVFAIVVLLNLIAGAAKTRLDMTADKQFTLSPGTKAILKKLDTPAELRFYFSRSEKNLPSWVPNFARNVEDLLAEFEQNGRGNITIKKFDPKPDSDAEDLALNDGIERQMTETGEDFFLGLAISVDPQRVSLPLTAAREKLLEYDIARAIARVMSTNKPVVGVMTPLPMFGQAPNPMMMRMGQQQQQQPWVAVTELQRDFEVKQVPMDTDKIDDEIQVLMVVHPREITDKAQFAIDQFVLRGGKLLALLDGMSVVDKPQGNNPMMGMLPGGGSNLEKLLKAWGLTFDTTKVVADLSFARELSFQRGGKPQLMPTWLFVNPDGINRDDVATSQIDNLLLPAAGSFSGTPLSSLKETVLLKTTKKSQLVDGMTAQFSGQKIADEFKPGGSELQLAVRLQGKFKTAYPDGKPEADKKDDEKKDDNKDAKKEEKKDDTLKESKKDSVVILMGDSDFIFDNFCVQIMPLFNIAQPINGNLTLLQNLVEQLVGDSNLIGVRSRASAHRPFTVVKKKEAEAQERFQSVIVKLQEELQDTQKQINELQGKKEPGQRFLLSKEQQQKIAEFRKKESDAKKKLKEVRKDLNREIDSLQTSLKWTNIIAMPIVVSIAGLVIAYFHRQRTKAQ
ncbi:MAG: Gldg family protein [Verrucomicrobia bacterium]|nr:Gldg family protein [Verrucomicrobiota bacterium]